MNTNKQLSIVLPTYREKDNILLVLEQLFNVANGLRSIKFEIIVVDDNSPDGTAEITRKNYKEVRVIVRKHSRGLASAILEGINRSRGEIICVMDSDMSHPPELLNKLYGCMIEGVDLAVASRHICGGGIERWPLNRRLSSKVARLMAYPITRINDPMSGYFIIKRSALRRIDFKPRGYKILLDFLARGDIKKYVEIPYIFKNREFGQSKMSIKTMTEFVVQILCLYCYKLYSVIIFRK